MTSAFRLILQELYMTLQINILFIHYSLFCPSFTNAVMLYTKCSWMDSQHLASWQHSETGSKIDFLTWSDCKDQTFVLQ